MSAVGISCYAPRNLADLVPHRKMSTAQDHPILAPGPGWYKLDKAEWTMICLPDANQDAGWVLHGIRCMDSSAVAIVVPCIWARSSAPGRPASVQLFLPAVGSTAHHPIRRRNSF